MTYIPQPLTDPAAALNAEFAAVKAELDALNARIDAGAAPAPEAWKTPTLQGSWLNYGAPYRDAGYRKMPDGTVRLRGLIKSGAVSSVAFVLPAGYRPAGTIMFIALSNQALGRVDVEADGSVRVQAPSSTAWVGIDHIAFTAEG